jgi:ureidoacrylate peracid hydrolase
VTTSPLATLVDPRHSAVLVVDVQPVFTDEDDPVLPVLRRFLAVAREAGVLRVFIRFVRADPPDQRWRELWEERCGADFVEMVAPNSPDAAFLSGFAPEAGDLEVTKDRYSPFICTKLADQLRSRGIETVLVTGFSTDVCVSSTARDAFQLDFRTVTLSDCCAAAEPARHEAALETLGRRFGRVCASDEVITAWQTQHTAAVAANIEARERP